MITLANGWTLRVRQEECHDKIISTFNNGGKEFLLAANCRFGKTITSLQSLKDCARGEDHVILIVCTMSVKDEWEGGAKKVGYDTTLLKEDTINTIDFNSLSAVGQHVIYVSTQKLGNNSAQSEALIRWFNQHSGKKFIIYDECHQGSGTDRTKGILERLDFDGQLYLSGTPYRKHLKDMFDMDRLEGENKIFLYTLINEREDYKNGLITDYVPVQLSMQVFDYSDRMDELTADDEKAVQKYGVSSAYFKKIFSSDKYEEEAIEFLDKIIAFAENKNVKNFLFFVPLIVVGNDLVKRYAKRYADKIEFRNLCGDYTTDDRTESDDEANAKSDAEKLNAFYATPSNKIKIGITCNKCGTGATLIGLDVVAFLKDTTNAISFIQKSQRVRTPEEGKTIGYCLCFNQWQGLTAFMDYAKTAYSKKENPNPKQKEAVSNLIENGAVKLVLNMTEIDDYASIIDIMGTYEPGRYPLFSDFEFEMWPEDTFVFLTTVNAYKQKLYKDNPKLRNAEDIKNAKTPEELATALRNRGMDKEADKVPQACSPEEMRLLLEQNYVDIVRWFYECGKSKEEVSATENYDEMTWKIVTANFGTREIWTYILNEYVPYVSMVYNYLDKQN